MKLSPVFYLLVALVLMTVVLVGVPGREKFRPEFLDTRQEQKTVAVEDSSYAQRTNHMQYGQYSMGPLQGMETPFRVNQYKAYVP